MKPEKKTRRLTVSGAEKRDSLDLVAELTEGWNGLLLLLINCDDFFVSAAGLFLLVFWKNRTVRNQLSSPQPKFWELFLIYCCLVVWLRKGVTTFPLIFLAVFTCSAYRVQVIKSSLLLYSCTAPVYLSDLLHVFSGGGDNCFLCAMAAKVTDSFPPLFSW